MREPAELKRSRHFVRAGRMGAEEKQVMAHRYLVGVDPGVNTGIAVFDTFQGVFTRIETMGVVRAMHMVASLQSLLPDGSGVLLLVEDPRKTGRSGPLAAAMAQGAGSVKRDASMWQEFAEVYRIKTVFVRPSPSTFTKSTPRDLSELLGWTGRTSNHGRDAAFLIATNAGSFIPVEMATRVTLAAHGRARRTRKAPRGKR